MPTLDSLRHLWVNVRSFAATEGIYDADADRRAYAAIVEGDCSALSLEVISLADRAGVSHPERIKFSKPKTKTPATEKGTRAFAMEAHAKLSAKHFVATRY